MFRTHLIGNAHLDPVWLWRWQEGCNEVMQTFRSALDRMNEYDDFIFTCSSAAYYAWVEDIDPEMFAEICQRVKEGRWVPVNGWWVQPDCNMPSGESFARQALYSQLYYYGKFGKICCTGYNVDTFGHNGNLPQLLKQAGMNGYVMMRPSSAENGEIPQGCFIWEGVDGTQIPTFHIPNAYCGTGSEWIEKEIKATDELSEINQTDSMLFYGVGNHGGGPTRFDIEYIKNHIRMKQNQISFSSPDSFFEVLKEQGTDALKIWKDELQHHASGCYSAMSQIKMLNRQAENSLLTAEWWDTVVASVFDKSPASEKIAEAWKSVCFNQFHDILCGCCIMEAYQDAEMSMGHAMYIANTVQNRACIRIARSIDTWIDGVSDPVCSEVRHLSGHGFPVPVVVFNPLSWNVHIPVRALRCYHEVKDSNGNVVSSQIVRGSRSDCGDHLDTLFLANVPSMGYAVYWLNPNQQVKQAPCVNQYSVQIQEDAFSMENEYIRVEFDAQNGVISSLLDKKSGCECISKNAALPIVIDDDKNDTWGHGRFIYDDFKGYMKVDGIEWIEKGALRSAVRIRYSYEKSIFVQDFYLAESQKYLQVKCKVVWQEPHTMLKVSFPIIGEDAISTYEIPYGYIKRPVNGEEEPALKWADVTATQTDGSRHGIAILNNGKYSYSCKGNDLRLTCVRNALYADHFFGRENADLRYTDEGLQRFEYAIYPHNGEAEQSEVVKLAKSFNQRPYVVSESYHKGNAGQTDSFLQVDVDNVIIETCKFAEDASGDLIVRCYETAGLETQFTITSKLKKITKTFTIESRKIMTLRISDADVTQVDFLEGITD